MTPPRYHPRFMTAASSTSPTATAGSTGFSAAFARVVLDYLQAQGLESAPVAKVLGLGEASSSDVTQRVPARQLAQALALAARLCGDPQVGLRIAAFVRPAHMGALGYALMSCDEGGDGLALFDRMQSLICNEIRVHHQVSHGMVDIRHELLGAVPRDYPFWSFFVAARLAFARWVSGRALVPVRLELPCPAPPDAKPLQDFVGAPLRFDAPDCRELLPADWLSFANPNADRSVHELMSSLAAQQWQAAHHNADETVSLLMQRIVAGLHEGTVPTLTAIAKALGTSERQLQRRLSEHGLGFKEVVEQVRREQALNHLKNTELPLVQVAQLSGYAEPSSFHRAVRRWTGLTPLAVRAQARGVAAAPGPDSPQH
ncbi:MAG: AraC family transcriptional regulator [Rubrivivax sp.]|nr:MAG: AraC family transcriptional regulator [Rubrivivax sp.]